MLKERMKRGRKAEDTSVIILLHRSATFDETTMTMSPVSLFTDKVDMTLVKTF